MHEDPRHAMCTPMAVQPGEGGPMGVLFTSLGCRSLA